MALGWLAVRGLVPVVGELDEAGLAGDVVGELVHEVFLPRLLVSWPVIVVLYDCAPRHGLLTLSLRAFGLDDTVVVTRKRSIAWVGGNDRRPS